MKVSLRILIILLITISSHSCIQEEHEKAEYDSIALIEKENIGMINSLKAEIEKISYSKNLRVNLSENLKQEEFKALFFIHLENYKILNNGKVHQLSSNSELQNLYEQVIEKLLILESMEYSNYRVSNSIPPTREEIRDALMKECASYSAGLSEACQAAVYIAYYLG